MDHGSDHRERRMRLALALTPGLDAAALRRLLQAFGAAQAVLSARQGELLAAGVRPAAAVAIRGPDWRAVDAALCWCAGGADRHLLLHDDPAYPPLLLEIPDPPPALFVRGDPAVLCRPQLAMVGSRAASRSGCRHAMELAQALAGAGYVVTSGLARGIDASAHRGALAAGGQTVAVCGAGLDQVYPRQHAALAEDICRAGALVAELPPDAAPLAGNFPRRNRIISGLSLGVVVVQARPRSGSLITARHALDQGREVFALPGDIDDPLAAGCNDLIQRGAKLVLQAADVCAEIGQFFAPPRAARPRPMPQDPDARALFALIGSAPIGIEELIRASGLTPAGVSSILLKMELDGLIESRAGSAYVRA